MKLTRLIAIGIIWGSVGALALNAQDVRPGDQPAEFPPASFKGNQYVDSRGCVFIRAGIDGTVSWIPRVTRNRTGVCGFKPTYAGTVETVPRPVPADAQQITNTPAVATATVRPQPKPAPQVVRQTPKTVAKAPVAVSQAPVTTNATVDTGSVVCPGGSAISQRYTVSTERNPVRCGPQSASIIGARIGTVPPPPQVKSAKVVTENTPITVNSNTRIVPRHVAVSRVNTTNVTVPKGYRSVWDDGRLNPRRAEQTLAGHRAMQLIWTSTVPRRLINQTGGQDVTAKEPLVYPYTNYQTQQQELGEVTIVQRNGTTAKRLVRKPSTVQPVYSSRSAPKQTTSTTQRRATPKAEAAGKGFVQVGSFDDAASAQAQAKKVQRLGLPVRIGRYTRDGKTTRLVIAGPFGGQGAVDHAVSQLKGAGFSGVFARR
ncbi:SPOR domain-containing protein [Sulfitobacter sp. SK012]|uniref:SPOR domain-containing protein n=1 Tax=Sulfitobacter sp. SK012 TaxID=1389005 RepID=UPI000E0B1756|nr:SPOR domain-containing protein [Sulfitobacter sp. SK012]AXI45408.1 SPOR domain-containing protein [Sulfitobacter sp. SK012]